MKRCARAMFVDDVKPHYVFPPAKFLSLAVGLQHFCRFDKLLATFSCEIKFFSVAHRKA
jgi:hypothetical protein